MLLDGFEQHRRLNPVPGAVWLGGDETALDRVLDRGDDELHAELGDTPVSKPQNLRKVVARVDVHDRERDRSGTKSLLGKVQHDNRVLATGEEQHGALELRSDLAHDVGRLGLEHGELIESVVGCAHRPTPTANAELRAASRSAATSRRQTTRSGR